VGWGVKVRRVIGGLGADLATGQAKNLDARTRARRAGLRECGGVNSQIGSR
jgi:hypothetical protein